MDGIKPITFLFITGTIDVILTTIVVLSNWAIEVNPIVSWITPTWLMCIVEMVGFAGLCLLVIRIYERYKEKYPLNTIIYSWGTIHIACSFSSLFVLAQVFLI